MALMGCVTSRTHEALLHAVEEAVKENAITRLQDLLEDTQLNVEAMNYKHLLHQAAWLGHPRCVKILLQQGAHPDQCHRKNGCTPLHLAHFCTIEDTNPEQTINSLIAAGASVNNPGSHKCGKFPIDHAIQHQRLDSVQALLKAGSLVMLQSVLISIDVSSPQILQTLLMAGGRCGNMLEATLFWGQPLHRVLYTPLKCPKECYKQMFKLLVQATVCTPVLDVSAEAKPTREPSNQHLMIETELRQMARDYVDLSVYLYAALLRNGLYPGESMKSYMKSLQDIDWVDGYLTTPSSLSEMCVRVARSHLFLSGNIHYGVSKLDIPARLKLLIIMPNPL